MKGHREAHFIEEYYPTHIKRRNFLDRFLSVRLITCFNLSLSVLVTLVVGLSSGILFLSSSLESSNSERNAAMKGVMSEVTNYMTSPRNVLDSLSSVVHSNFFSFNTTGEEGLRQYNELLYYSQSETFSQMQVDTTISAIFDFEFDRFVTLITSESFQFVLKRFEGINGTSMCALKMNTLIVENPNDCIEGSKYIGGVDKEDFQEIFKRLINDFSSPGFIRKVICPFISIPGSEAFRNLFAKECKDYFCYAWTWNSKSGGIALCSTFDQIDSYLSNIVSTRNSFIFIMDINTNELVSSSTFERTFLNKTLERIEVSDSNNEIIQEFSSFLNGKYNLDELEDGLLYEDSYKGSFINYGRYSPK